MILHKNFLPEPLLILNFYIPQLLFFEHALLAQLPQLKPDKHCLGPNEVPMAISPAFHSLSLYII